MANHDTSHDTVCDVSLPVLHPGYSFTHSRECKQLLTTVSGMERILKGLVSFPGNNTLGTISGDFFFALRKL